MHHGGFIGRDFQGGFTKGDFAWGRKGGFTERRLSYYQFSEWRSAFKHVGRMTVVIKHASFDK